MENEDDLESLVARPWAITKDCQTQKDNTHTHKYQPESKKWKPSSGWKYWQIDGSLNSHKAKKAD